MRGNQKADRNRGPAYVRVGAAPLILLLEIVVAVLVSRVSTSADTSAGPPSPRMLDGASTPLVLLGPPDWSGYCAATGQGAARLDAGRDAYGWYCAVPSRAGDDPRAVCRWTYGTAQAIDTVTDFYDPRSWVCWQVGTELGPLDFGAYCRAVGSPGARPVLPYAYGWRCVGDTAAIDADAACDVLYHGTDVARFQNFYDKDSWQCWG